MLKKLTERIYISDFDSSNDRPRLGYVKGNRFNLMIDAGNSPAHFNWFIEECLKLGLNKPDYILLTHWHWDHVFGIADNTIPAICSSLTQVKLEEMSQWKWDDASMKQRLVDGNDIEFCDTNMRIEYQDCKQIKVRKADFTFLNEIEIDCGDITCSMKRVDNDHAPDSCVIYIKEEKILFLGDIISEDYHHGEPHYTHDKFYRMWETIFSYDINYAIHGHTEILSKQTLSSFYEESKNYIKGSI